MIAQGNAVKIPLPDQSVHCCMTSPPYWGLRKYAGEQGEEPLGLESTPERHVERMVDVFREVKRVLRDDGVVWLNYGDCYSAAGWESNRRSVVGQGSFDPAERKSGKNPGVRAGSLMMMPHRVALALQADGWIVRQDLVWYKRNPMPESVNGWRWQKEREKIANRPDPTPGTYGAKFDHGLSRQAGYRDEGGLNAEYEYGDELELKRGSWRHTRAHEFVFQLVKNMGYWSNQEAVRERFQTDENENYPNRSYILGRGGLESLEQSPDGGAQRRASGGYPPSGSGRNPRSVLDVPTQPYKGSHYATFPVNLIAPLIRATCPRRACSVCGQGWAAVVEKGEITSRGGSANPDRGKLEVSEHLVRQRADGSNASQFAQEFIARENKTLGYRPTCEHPHTQEEAVPGIVFDPFVGSGTTIAVAKELLRRGIGIDISMEYLDQQAKVRAGLGSPSNMLNDLPLFR